MTSTPSLLKISSKAALNLASRSRTGNLALRPPVLQLPGQVPRLLDDPCPARAVGAAREVDAMAAELDPEQHVELGQPYGIHHEEVNRQDLIGVLTNEFTPGTLASARRWQGGVATEHSTDGHVGAAVAELEELALNAAIASP